MNHGITYVTSIYTINEGEWSINHLKVLVDSGINLYIFLEKQMYDIIRPVLHDKQNIQYKIIDIGELKAYEIYVNIASQKEIKIPSFRNFEKDTLEYIIYTNTKAELLENAINENFYQTQYFAWIDFNIFCMIRQKECSQKWLRKLSQHHFLSTMFAIPGCIPKFNEKEYNDIVEHPFWRFCTSFFIADRDSMLQFCNIYYDYYLDFLQKYNRLIWDMNLMSWMELHSEKWKPHWYIANHNDSILYIPSQFYVKCLMHEGAEKTEYPYPPLLDHSMEMYPSSASYLYFHGKHILNTRYVNYYFRKDGHYHIHELNGTIYTKNVRCVLDDNTMMPLYYGEMLETSIGLSSATRYSHGLEDLRIFEYMDKIWFVCTNVNYSYDGRNRIMIGEYDPEELCYRNCKILKPPTETMCEKNWIPILRSSNKEELFFIYSWFPMQIGIIAENDTLKIIKTVTIREPLFYKIRGSSIFIKDPENPNTRLIGVVHYSEETFPRKYYHLLVVLDAESFEPIMYSDPFCFQHCGIEFCIGFTITQKDQYIFWVSKNDNNAAMITIDRNKIPINNLIIYAH